jgi:mannose-6-phosphate isomerase-like protein (cupin superfamily)
MAETEWVFSRASAGERLPDPPSTMRYHEALRRGGMKLGLYAPRGADSQGPHRQDELYIVVSGSGIFVKNGERRRFAAHDVIFVEAGAEHRFETFTDDFETWVVFWGPDGGAGRAVDPAAKPDPA